MCCVIRKMNKALPRNAGTQSGFSVLYQCKDRQIRKLGIIVTWAGSIIVASRTMKETDRPGQLNRANAYATKLAEKSEPTVISTTSRIELEIYFQNGTALNARS